MRAREIMQRSVVTLSPDDTLTEAARRFAARGISGAPVVGHRRKLLGVVSQTDLLRRHEQHSSGAVPAFYKDGESISMTTVTEEPGRALVREVMTPAVLCAEEDTPVEQLAAFMLKRRVHRVIITAAGALRGIVTSMDLLRVLAQAGTGEANEDDARRSAARRAGGGESRGRAGGGFRARARRGPRAHHAGRRQQRRRGVPR